MGAFKSSETGPRPADEQSCGLKALIPRRPADPGSGGFCVRVARTSGRWEASALSALSAAVGRADNADKADNGMRVGLCVNHRHQDHWPRPSSRRNTVGCWCGAATNRQIVKAGLFLQLSGQDPHAANRRAHALEAQHLYVESAQADSSPRPTRMIPIPSSRSPKEIAPPAT